MVCHEKICLCDNVCLRDNPILRWLVVLAQQHVVLKHDGMKCDSTKEYLQE